MHGKVGKLARVVWSCKFAVYLGTAGAAVGLGSIWRFPYLAGTGCGSAFILVFVIACVLIATPLLAAEFSLGRGSRRSPPYAAGADELAETPLRFRTACIGLLRYLCPLGILVVFTANLF